MQAADFRLRYLFGGLKWKRFESKNTKIQGRKFLLASLRD
jgi:hypothetical protein